MLDMIHVVAVPSVPGYHLTASATPLVSLLVTVVMILHKFAQVSPNDIIMKSLWYIYL